MPNLLAGWGIGAPSGSVHAKKLANKELNLYA